jgi:hypothetical protein
MTTASAPKGLLDQLRGKLGQQAIDVALDQNECIASFDAQCLGSLEVDN